MSPFIYKGVECPVYIGIDGKLKHLGYFISKKNAIEKRRAAEKEKS